MLASATWSTFVTGVGVCEVMVQLRKISRIHEYGLPRADVCMCAYGCKYDLLACYVLGACLPRLHGVGHRAKSQQVQTVPRSHASLF